MKNLKNLVETFLMNLMDDPTYSFRDVEADFLGEFETREELLRAYKAAIRELSKMDR